MSNVASDSIYFSHFNYNVPYPTKNETEYVNGLEDSDSDIMRQKGSQVCVAKTITG